MPTTYPTELKVKTIRRYEKRESIKALSEELHISQSTLYHWRKEYCSIQTPNHTYTPAEFDAISGDFKNWNMRWKSSESLGISQRCHCKTNWRL